MDSQLQGTQAKMPPYFGANVQAEMPTEVPNVHGKAASELSPGTALTAHEQGATGSGLNLGAGTSLKPSMDQGSPDFGPGSSPSSALKKDHGLNDLDLAPFLT